MGIPHLLVLWLCFGVAPGGSQNQPMGVTVLGNLAKRRQTELYFWVSQIQNPGQSEFVESYHSHHVYNHVLTAYLALSMLFPTTTAGTTDITSKMKFAVWSVWLAALTCECYYFV